MVFGNDFSTNQSHGQNSPHRHPDLYFSDGNIVILTGPSYFMVHQGLLTRHSEVLEKLIHSMDLATSQMMEGRPVLPLTDHFNDMAYFLQALYDGISFLSYDSDGWGAVSGALRLLTKYKVHHLRNDVLRCLSLSWPTTLAQWEARETSATDADGIYAPRRALPHPIEIIRLAHEVEATSVLPSAMYDLARCTPSQAAIGCVSSQNGAVLRLSDRDLLRVLRGREHASRFFSTFIVNELEGREPSRWCIHRKADNLLDRRTCQIAFESITFELLRDVNGVVYNRTSDPLYAMLDAELMQTKESPAGDLGVPSPTTCEACRSEFAAVVDAGREEFWRSLPIWFEVEVSNWG